MRNIKDYCDLIKVIPVNNQSGRVKKDVWSKFSYNDDIKNAIFENNEVIEISRADVLFEKSIAKKIVMALMWGYPSGGRGNNIKRILDNTDNINSLSEILSKNNGANLTKNEASVLIKELDNIKGMGISTWSKLLYFFNVSIESKKCQIYDMKIVESLNKKQFRELDEQNQWEQDVNHYYKYIELVDNLASSMGVLPEQVEVFLFYYNHDYKFTE